MLGRASAVATALVACFPFATAEAAATDIAEQHLRFDWYRVEVVVFRRDDAGLEVGRPRLLDAFRLPRLAAPLVEPEPPEMGLVLNPRRPPSPTPAPLFVSNLPPPAWLGGKCAAERWTPPAGTRAPDPCLWRRPVARDLEAHFPDEWSRGLRVPNLPPDEEAAPFPTDEPTVSEDLRAELVARLEEASAEHEERLLATSYLWRRTSRHLAALLPPLRRRFDVLAAGSWHQPVPPRDAPFPLLVEWGSADSSTPFVLQGSFGATRGRYLHFEARLLLRLAENATALLTEKRRMRAGERHYLDHPAFGIIVSIISVELPAELRALAEDLEALDGNLGEGELDESG